LIHLQARLLPEPAQAQELTDTLIEFARCCQWVHERAHEELTDRDSLHQAFYNSLRRETILGGAHCKMVASSVAAYRRATEEFSVVDGPINPRKLVYYSNSLSIEGHRACILLLGHGDGPHGRTLIPFDLPKPQDYQALKAGVLKRADLFQCDDCWYLNLLLVPSEINFAAGNISFGESVTPGT